LQQARRPIVVLVVALALALILEAGFFLGQHTAYRDMGAKPKNYKAMQAQLIAVQDALRSRDAELAIQLTRNEVDRHALEMVRKELAGQEEAIAGLEEGLGFYRSLMSPDEVAPGLSLRGLELTEAGQPRQYNYRIVVQQEARKHDQVQGSLIVRLKGVQDGRSVELGLEQLSEDFDGGPILQFRYFQSIEGRLTLPEGFDPGAVVVQVRTRKPAEIEIREEYPWKLEERFTHVGK
jgi:hypothetical protein